MIPASNKAFTARGFTVAVALVMVSGKQVMAKPLAQVTLDGLTRADGIRSWIEITEPGNLGLLLMGIAGLLIGRWASRNKRKGPPE